MDRHLKICVKYGLIFAGYFELLLVYFLGHISTALCTGAWWELLGIPFIGYTTLKFLDWWVKSLYAETE